MFQARYLVSRSVEFDVKLIQAPIPQSVYTVYSYLCVSLKRIAFSLVVKAVLKGSAMCILGTAQKHNDHPYSTSPANWTAERLTCAQEVRVLAPPARPTSRILEGNRLLSVVIPYSLNRFDLRRGRITNAQELGHPRPSSYVPPTAVA